MASEIDLVKFDDVFLGILQHLGKIEPFLEAVFFFLARRTDFFRLMHNRDDKMGFPPGVAEKLVLKIFKKYQKVVLGSDSHTKKEEKPEKIKEVGKKQDEATSVPEPVKIVEVETTSDKISQPKTQKLVEKVEQATLSALEEESQLTTKENDGQSSVDAGVHSNESQENKPPDLNNPDAYNGAVTDTYCWSQSPTEVDVKVPVPCFIRKSRDILVELKTDKLKVTLKNDPPADSGLASRILVDGKLSKPIRCEESIWSLVPGECVQVHLEKTKELYWTALLEGEPEIDKTKLDTTRNIAEFDDQTQADFQKVMYDHQQKLQGKPTSDEQKTYDLLKQAWDAEGSPFKGTPYDPSQVNISSGNG